MRAAVVEISKLGQLPSSDAAIANADAESLLEKFDRLITSIQEPVTDEEARVLLRVLRSDEDECFGLATTIVTLVETAPSWPLWDSLADTGHVWIRKLRYRASRGDELPTKA